jgi:outer membrane protein, multidrug efflux system
MFRNILASYRFRIVPIAVAALVAGAPAIKSQTLPAALPEDLVPELKQLLDSAVKQSPTTLARSLDVAQREADYLVDRSGLLPTVSGSGSYAVTETSLSSNTSSKSSNDGFFYGVSFNQPIFHWGALKAQADYGKIGIKIGEKLYADAYRTLALSVRSQFLGLVAKKMAVRNAAYAVRASESYLALQEARLRDGRISSGEIIAPRLAVEEARVQSERAQVDYDQSRRLLAIAVGVSEIPDAMVPADLPKPAFAPETLASYFESMKSADLGSTFMGSYYQLLVDQGQKRYDVAKVRLLPKLSLTASYNQQNLTTVNGASVQNTAITSTMYGVTGYWTIFDGLATRGAKLSALAAKRLAERNLETYKTSTAEQVRLLERQIGFAGRLMDLTETRKELALAAVRKVSDDVRSGVVSQSALENTTMLANKAELDALSSRIEFLSRWAEYVSLLGVDPALNNLPPRFFRNGQ